MDRRVDEREKRWLEKRYRLPEQPQILCHPVPQRSLDKFTCEVMSLSILLDYRPEDTKKHCFEVSLFAELFNEMLMRDFGFNIYKMLSLMPDIEKSLEKDSKDKNDTNHPKTDDDEPNTKRARNDAVDANEITRHSKKGDSNKRSEIDRKSESKDKDKNHRDRDRERSNREKRTSRREDETDEDNTSMRSTDGKRRETKKMIVVDPDLLLSFVYFDQDHCGYIFTNHLEDLFHSLGLMLSRADTKRIISRIGARSLIYR